MNALSRHNSEQSISAPQLPEQVITEQYIADQAILEQAAHWFITLQEEPNCAKQQAALKRWLMSEHNQIAWQQICQVDKLFSPINQHIPKSIASQTLLSSSSNAHRNISRRGAIKGLFSLAIASVFSWQTYPLAAKRWQYAQADYNTAIGDMDDYLLADGSQLWLNTNSAVNASFNNSVTRLTLLQGEIAITTAKNSAKSTINNIVKDKRHFFVESKLEQEIVIIEALGTEFTVRKTAENITVNVQSGQVALTVSKQYYVINQGEQLSYNHDKGGLLSTLDDAVNDWKQGKFTAYNLPLADLCSELSRYTPALISVDDDIAQLKVVGTFPIMDIEQSMQLLAESLPIALQARTKWWWLLSAN